MVLEQKPNFVTLGNQSVFGYRNRWPNAWNNPPRVFQYNIGTNIHLCCIYSGNKISAVYTTTFIRSKNQFLKVSHLKRERFFFKGGTFCGFERVFCSAGASFVKEITFIVDPRRSLFTLFLLEGEYWCLHCLIIFFYIWYLRGNIYFFNPSPFFGCIWLSCLLGWD